MNAPKKIHIRNLLFPTIRMTELALCIGLIGLSLFFVACGGLGKIQSENIDQAIADATQAIESARLANAEMLAPDTLKQAEDALATTRQAVEEKKGLDALRFSYDAKMYARAAEQEAIYSSQEQSKNAIVTRKEAAILELQTSLRKMEEELEKARTEMQQLDAKSSQQQVELERKLRDSERERQQSLQSYRAAEAELGQLQDNLNATQAQYQRVQDQTEAYERQLYQLRRELALAQSMADEARKEATEAKSKARTQAKSYTTQIEQNTVKQSAAEREKMLAQKAQAARDYVQQREKLEPMPSGVTSLTDAQIAQGRAAIDDWEIAWASKDTTQHLGEYAQYATVTSISIEANTEKRSELNRTQMAEALRKMIHEEWVKTDARFETDGESVVATYLFSRLSRNAKNEGQPALYDVWTRQTWVNQVGNGWKISREIWRIYRDVPKYATIFN